jgi:hypothetical protein
MSLVRRIVAFVALCGAVVATAGPVSAKTSPVQASGHVHCTAVGKVTYTKPYLTLLSFPGVVAKFKASLTCSVGQTGNAAVKIVSGKLKGQSSAYIASCAAANPKSASATIKWKATGGKVLPTTVSWGAATGGTSPYTHAFSGGTVTGSYAGEAAAASFVADAVSQASCGLKGIKKWTFGTTGTSAIDINVPPPPPCGPIATHLSGAEGSNGDHWLVVVPAAFPSCATHPTGTLAVTGGSPCPAFWSGQIQDSGASSDLLGGPYPSHLWGLDTGHTLSYIQTFCPGESVTSASYSGDSLYQGF